MFVARGKGVAFAEPRYEMYEEEPEELCYAPLDRVMVVQVVCSGGQGVEEGEPEHWHGFSCSASFVSVATQGPSCHLQH